MSHLEVVYFCIADNCFSVRSPPKIPEVHIPEEPILQLASGLRIEINRGFSSLREIASGRDLKKFLIVSSNMPSRNYLELGTFYVFLISDYNVPLD